MIARVLSVGTNDPRNVAGIGRDIIVGTELGCNVVTAVAAVSVQDDRGVHALHVVPSTVLRAQLVVPSARVARIGALACSENVAVVADWLARPGVVAVVDPVMHASAGGVLADAQTAAAVRDRLATLPSVVLTPNLPEAQFLLACRIEGVDAMQAAAIELRARGTQAVLLKGGHGTGDPTDVLATAEGTETFSSPRIDTTMGGKGCTLAMALACGIARNLPLREAVIMARAYVRAKMMQAGSRNAAPA